MLNLKVNRGLFSITSYMFDEDVIKVDIPLVPEIELIIRDNVVDTLYAYWITK